jgi:hypothetical protein
MSPQPRIALAIVVFAPRYQAPLPLGNLLSHDGLGVHPTRMWRLRLAQRQTLTGNCP